MESSIIAPRTVAIAKGWVRLTHDFIICTPFGVVCVPKGFEYDGASIPRPAQFLLLLNRFDPRLRAAACVHDYLYRTGLFTRKEADLVYKQLMQVNGIGKIRANIHYEFLRACGWTAWNKHRKNEIMTNKEKEFVTFIDSLGLRYFTGAEILQSTRKVRNGVKNTIPPKSKWNNIKDASRVIDELRHNLGVPITIASSYRNEKYNKKCGGVRYSQHKEFKAFDLQCKRKRPKTIYRALLAMRQAGDFSGGLGEYKTFVHIDTRGTNATWKGKGV